MDFSFAVHEIGDALYDAGEGESYREAGPKGRKVRGGKPAGYILMAVEHAR